MNPRVLVLTLAALVAGGCQTPPQLAEMKALNTELKAQLATTQTEVDRLIESEERLNKEVTYVKYVQRVLEKEKQVRVGEAEGLRQETRAFIRDQMQTIHEFAQREVLLNYVGSELAKRALVKGDDQLVVDLRNRIPSDGTLMEGRIYLAEPAPFAFVIVREIQDQYIILWKSDTYMTTTGGLNEITFDVPVSAQAGDCIGAYFPQAVQVPFDYGTGDTRFRKGPARLGDRFPLSGLKEDNDRTYSFGVAGLFE